MKGFVLILGTLALVFVGCASPTGGNSGGAGTTAVSGNAIIKSVTMKNVSPTNTTSSRAAVVVSTPNASAAHFATAASLFPGNVPAALVGLMQSYIGSSTLSLGAVNSMAAGNGFTLDAATNPFATTADVGSSRIEIVTSATDVLIYWKTTLSFHGGAGDGTVSPVQIKLDLHGFTPGVYTDYTLATAWINMLNPAGTIPVNQIVEVNNLSAGTLTKYSPYLGSQGSGEVMISGKASGGGVYQYLVREAVASSTPDPTGTPEFIQSFGDSVGVVTYDAYNNTYNYYYYGGTPNQTDLDSGLNSNTPAIASATWASVAAPGTTWYGYYGAFDSATGVGTGTFNAVITEINTVLP